MNVTTRIAPANSRMMHTLTSRQTPAAPALIQRMSVSATAADPVPVQPEPAPAAPSAPADTAARLDDHEARITGLEQRSPPPAVDTGSQAATPAASAVAVAPAARMLSSTEIYAKMNGQPTAAKAVTASTSPPAMIQTSAGPILNARAIHDRHNAAAAARIGRRR